MLRRDTERVTPLYREKSYKRIERAEEKEKEKKNWVRSGKEKSEAVFFVKATSRGELAEACRREIKKANLEIKVLEKNRKISENLLSKVEPIQESGLRKRLHNLQGWGRL